MKLQIKVERMWDESLWTRYHELSAISKSTEIELDELALVRMELDRRGLWE